MFAATAPVAGPKEANEWSIPIRDALAQYVDESPYLAERTKRDYRAAIERFIAIVQRESGTVPLLDGINSHTIVAYQRGRVADGVGRENGISHKGVNKDVGVVRTLLRWSGLWLRNVTRYRPLPPQTPRKEYVPTPQDISRIITVGMKYRRWEVALWASVLSANTGMMPQEVRFLKLKDLHLTDDDACTNGDFGFVESWRKCKTIFRDRELPLNVDARLAIDNLLKRLDRLGFGAADDYLIPHRRKIADSRHSTERFDPTRPASQWNKAWANLVRAAGLPRMRPYVMRHYFATEIEKTPVSRTAKLRLMGHSPHSDLLEKVYTHVHMNQMREAVTQIGVEIPGLIHRPATRVAPISDDAKANRDLILQALSPFIREGEKRKLQQLACTTDTNPSTPGAHLYSELNLVRLWSLIDRTHVDGCWVWKGPMQGNNRAGALWTGTRTVVARRAVYELVTDDPLPNDKVRLYPTCKTPMCVNPEHMLVGQRPALAAAVGAR